MNPNSEGPALTLDETIRLAIFLAKRGYPEALLSVAGSLATSVYARLAKEA